MTLTTKERRIQITKRLDDLEDPNDVLRLLIDESQSTLNYLHRTNNYKLLKLIFFLRLLNKVESQRNYDSPKLRYLQHFQIDFENMTIKDYLVENYKWLYRTHQTIRKDLYL